MRGNHVNIITEIARALYKSGQNKRYLEIGILRAKCFNMVANYFKDSVAVDIFAESKKFIKVKSTFFCATSDNYFEKYYDGVPFNLIFIDALHNINDVEIDFINSYRSSKQNSLILIHDTYPVSKEEIKKCKDAYKISDWIKNNKQIKGELVTLPFYCGITIFRKF